MATPEPHLRLAGGDWTGRPPPLPRRLRFWTVTQWLIAVNVAVYVLQELTDNAVTDLGVFRIDAGLSGLQLWRWVTCCFLHADPGHLVVNMIALWWFGTPIETWLGRSRYLAFYLLSGLGGVAGYLVVWRLRILQVTPDTELLGASGCIFGLVAASIRLFPNRIVRLALSQIQMRMATLCWIYVGWAALNVLHRGQSAGGDAAHLGGAAVGFVLVRNLNWLGALRIGPEPRRFWKPGDPASNFFRPDA
jgi:membrane associated rhomboid family serine protease